MAATVRIARRAKLSQEIEFYKCRTTHRHTWDDYSPPADSKQRQREKKQRWGYRLYFLCTRCTTVKTVTYDARGVVAENPKYDYPDGYSMTKDETPERSTMVLAVVKEMRAQTAGRNARHAAQRTSKVGKRAKPRTATPRTTPSRRRGVHSV